MVIRGAAVHIDPALCAAEHRERLLHQWASHGSSANAARIFVVKSLAAVSECKRAVVTLRGGIVTDFAFFSSDGQHGQCAVYMGALQKTRYRLWLSDALVEHKPKLVRIFRDALADHQGHKWIEVTASEFQLAEGRSQPFRLHTIGLVTDMEKACDADNKRLLTVAQFFERFSKISPKLSQQCVS